MITGIHLLGAASPGPDFAMVLKNSIRGGTKSGVMTGLGISTGIIFHVAYSILGLALIISRSIVLFNIIKFVGAAYLIWIGIKSLRSKKLESDTDDMDDQSQSQVVSSTAAFRQGLLTNLLNPKVTLFFLSLFTQVIDPLTPTSQKSVYGIAMVVSTFAWFSFVAFVMTRKPILTFFKKVGHIIDRVFGGILIALGIKIAAST